MNEAEREEARYEAWVETGGPERAYLKQKSRAADSLDDVEAAGWDLLSKGLRREAGEPYPKVEAVVRKGDVVKLIIWNSFNQGWMEKGDHGWYQFKV